MTTPTQTRTQKTVRRTIVRNRRNMLYYTNVVCSSKADIHLDTMYMTPFLNNVIMKKSVMIWKVKRIGMTCLLYKTGKIIIMGKPPGDLNSVAMCHASARKCLRKYIRLLHVKFGNMFTIERIKLLTVSATYNVHGSLLYHNIINSIECTYEPEIFHGITLRRQHLHFIVFRTGKILITGIVKENDVKNLIHPFILELEFISNV